MIATIINAISVIIGSLLGLVIGNKLSDQFKKVIMTSAGLVTLILGVEMALKYENILILLFSLIIGGGIGYFLKLEDRVLSLSDRFEGKGDNHKGGVGFLTASVLFCSGAMSIVGSIQAGSFSDGTLIYTKSVMDGFMAIVLASIYGKGVIFSFIVILVYQGFFTLLSSSIASVLSDSGINAIASSGGFILILIAFSLLDIKKFKTGNFVPALFVAPLLTLLYLKLFS